MDLPLDRRTFGAALAGAATAAMLAENKASAQNRPALGTGVAEHNIVPLPFAPGGLGGISERMIRSHHDNNYALAVRKLNEIRQQLAAADVDHAGGYWSQYGSLKSAELAARNSAYLHELYFANLAANAGDAGTSPNAESGRLIADRFQSVDRFRALMLGAAKAASGWVVLAADASSRTLEIVATDGHAFGAWDAVPLLVLDVFEHAYAMDFGADKTAYFNAFWRNVHWSEVHRRTTAAVGRI